MSPAAPSVSIVQAQRFLDLLDAEAESWTFQTFDENKSGKNKRLTRILHGSLGAHADTLTQINDSGGGVFVMVNPGDGKGRAEKNVVGVRALFVDLDGAPLKPILEAGLDPSIIVTSSPNRFHAYWCVSDFGAPDSVKFARLQKALAKRFGGDPSVCDLPRVMRLPGFVHRKAKPFLTRIETL